ncbi:hypothetical protein [Nonomuraea jabiensis]|uniref:Uncharacterized protein n=1 Tax=Nonomuraea jabiensis TaxID=882448 RepID=A0A7W9G7M9_9ACTN|nr:hypothetical protein [Nonomuraea jabiensis]MBB5778729.1 hypothetical protein [Nonomuraea jabiensis]
MSSKISVPALCAAALLMPLVPAAIAPTAANVVTGAAVAALLVVPVVVLRRRLWAPRLGAALLALLAVAAAATPISGLGKPSQEEVARYVAGHSAGGRPVDFGDLRILPWDTDDLLLIALACLATAALLLTLGQTVRREGRPPLRWRWPLVMWGVALVLVSIPLAMLLAPLAGETMEYSIMIMNGDCFGGTEEIMFATAVLVLIPQPIVVAVGFGLWALLARTGHRPLGRLVGWLTVAPMVLRDLAMNWMPVLGCAQPSEEGTVNPVTLPWALYTLLPVVLIVLAVRVRRTPTPQVRIGR